jgi:hypothetical protein
MRVVSSGAGHMAPITHPALINPIFERFIEAVDASERRPILLRFLIAYWQPLGSASDLGSAGQG